MPNFLRTITSTFSANPITKHTLPSLGCLHNINRPFHNTPPLSQENGNTIVPSICSSLAKTTNWETLTQEFKAVHFTCPTIQKTLLQLKDPKNAKKALSFFHWSAQHNSDHFKHDISSYCITIHILVKANFIRDAKALLIALLSNGENHDFLAVLDSLLGSYKTTDSIPFVFDLFIQTCAKLRLIDSGLLDVCKILDGQGFTLSLTSYNTLLHVLQRSEHDYHSVWDLYEYMLEKRVYPNENTLKIMVNALSKEGKLKKFVDLVERIHKKKGPPGLVVNACLIYRMIEEGRIEGGLVLLKRMLQKDMIFDTVFCSLVVFAKVKIGDLDAAREVHEGMLKRGLKGNVFVSTLFIGVYCEAGRIQEAISLLDEMEHLGLKPFDETFDYLIRFCAVTGKLEESMRFCERMVSVGFIPSHLAFNEMIRELCENGDAERADNMLTLVLDKGFVPDESTYSYLINGFAKARNVEGALKIYYEMEYRTLSPGRSTFSSLITVLCQCGKLKEAEMFFIKMKNQSLVPSLDAYETLIQCCLENGKRTTARQLHREMVENGSETNDEKSTPLKDGT